MHLITSSRRMRGVPGANIFNAAMSMLNKVIFQYRSFIASTVSGDGQQVGIYSDPVKMWGMIEPIAKDFEHREGMVLAENKATLYTLKDLTDPQRTRSGDLVYFAGGIYEVVEVNDWMGQDGWNELSLIQVGDDTAKSGETFSGVVTGVIDPDKGTVTYQIGGATVTDNIEALSDKPGQFVKVRQ